MAAGHDRGARVLHRMCLDHPDKVERAAILDIIPQHHLLNNMTREWGHVLLALVLQHPARADAREDDGRRSGLVHPEEARQDAAGPEFFGKEALAEYMRCFRNPETIHAICEDYRATFGVDLEMDTKDFAAGRKITCPALILWGATGGVGRNHQPAEIWTRYAADIRGAKALPCGHYLSEEAPEETYQELRAFFLAK